MSRHRTQFFLDSSDIEPAGGVVTITGSDARHIVKVLRLKVGDTVRVVTPDGRTHLTRIERADPDAVECSLQSTEREAQLHSVEVTLAQAIPKGKLMEAIIRKATELGVAAIVPLQTERCVSRPKEEEGRQKLLRWRKIAAEAAKQSSRSTVPEVTPVKLIPQFLQDHPSADLKLILYEEEKAVSLKHALSEGRGESCIRPAAKVNVLIGAEGGFSPQEVETVRQNGYISVSLGPRILRADTASLALLSILMYELEELET